MRRAVLGAVGSGSLRTEGKGIKLGGLYINSFKEPVRSLFQIQGLEMYMVANGKSFSGGRPSHAIQLR